MGGHSKVDKMEKAFESGIENAFHMLHNVKHKWWKNLNLGPRPSARIANPTWLTSASFQKNLSTWTWINESSTGPSAHGMTIYGPGWPGWPGWSGWSGWPGNLVGKI